MVYGFRKRGEVQQAKSAFKQKPVSPIPRRHKEKSKPKATVSTAKILKRIPVKEVYALPKPRLRRRKHPGEHDLFLDHQDAIETSRATLLSDAQEALNATHTELTATLTTVHEDSTSFHKDISSMRDRLLSPLASDHIQSSFLKDGKSTTNIDSIGNRVDEFNATLVKTMGELGKLWEDWEKVQDQIVKLGVEVFGVEAFEDGQDLDIEVSKGYKKEMEIMELDHQTKLEEMLQDVEAQSGDAIDKMKAAEKNNAAQLKKDQAALISSMFGF